MTVVKIRIWLFNWTYYFFKFYEVDFSQRASTLTYFADIDFSCIFLCCIGVLPINLPWINICIWVVFSGYFVQSLSILFCSTEWFVLSFIFPLPFAIEFHSSVLAYLDCLLIQTVLLSLNPFIPDRILINWWLFVLFNFFGDFTRPRPL